MHKYQRLQATGVKATAHRLQARIAARFPGRNLGTVAGEITEAIDEMVLRPHPRFYRIALRLSRLALLGVLVLGLLAIGLLAVAAGTDQTPSVWEWVAVVESMINDVVFAGIAVFFLWHLPARMQRRHDLRLLHRLRSLAHIIDMHQLSKNPERLSPDYPKTELSVDLGMDRYELWNYLDYCSEMLSLVGKAAALLAEQTNDQTVLSTVEGIEGLTTGMSRKIWQKISLLEVER